MSFVKKMALMELPKGDKFGIALCTEALEFVNDFYLSCQKFAKDGKISWLEGISLGLSISDAVPLLKNFRALYAEIVDLNTQEAELLIRKLSELEGFKEMGKNALVYARERFDNYIRFFEQSIAIIDTFNNLHKNISGISQIN